MLFSITSVSLYALTFVTEAYASVEAACACNSGFVSIPVDVVLPIDPSSPAGLNSTDTFRLQTIFDVYGELCEPITKSGDAVQMLLHGFSYTSQYWNFNANGFQNYSYVAHSCSNGISSFAYDTPGAGRTTRPVSTDCQLPTASNISSSIARELKSGMINRLLSGQEKRFTKVVGVGHSLGSSTLSYAAIHDGERSPFDGLILTVKQLNHGRVVTFDLIPASQISPGRFSGLDPGYVTTPNESVRSIFYGPTATSFSQDILTLDFLTQDVGSTWMGEQNSFTYEPANGFKGPVVEMVGSFDSLLCLPSRGPCDRTSLQGSEAFYWPDSRNFSVILIDGFGHDLNLEFGAAKAFSVMNELFEAFVA
ncbi:hypothetical protein K439DRAFT_1351088 [Ramaria rubella]|nr:hypothetical protein K439DRAFT_1351088 [Ramaria rubella]